jgi:hypothetical protein
MRFILGLLLGLTLLAGYVLVERYRLARDPCAGRCGEGTRCSEGLCVRQGRARSVASRRRRKRRRTRSHSVRQAEQLKQPTAAQLRRVVKGRAPRTAEVVDMAQVTDDGPELSQEAITARMRRIDAKVASCIDQASRGYALPGVRLELRFRVERSGTVSAVRVDAPAVLQHNGLYGCVAPLVRGLSFPRSSAAVVATYPYSVQ